MGIQDDILADDLPDSVARLDFATQNPLAAPDKSARIIDMQMKTGLPQELIENNLDLVEREAANVDFDPDKFLKESPVTASWVAEHPNHWALVKDEWESMGRAEWLWKAFGAAKAEGWDEVELNRIWNRRKEGRATGKDVARGELLEKRIGGHDFGAGSAGLFITDMAKQLPQMMAGMKRGAELGMASAVGGGTIGLISGGPPGAVAGFGITGTAGFASGIALHAYEQESGADYRQLIQEGVDPDIARVSASVSGFINALLEATGTMAITSQIPGVRQLRGALVRDSMKSLLKQPTFLRAMGRFAKGTSIGVGGEVATEITQEAVSMLVSEVAKNADPQSFAPLTREQFTDSLKQIAAVTFRATLLPGAAGPTVQVAIDTNRVRRARTNRRIFEALGENAEEQTLKDKLPAKYREFVERIREKGAVKAVNIPVDRFDEYFQSQDIDPAEMAEELTGSPDAYIEAKAAGTDLEIKNEDFAEKLLNSEHYEGLIDDLRLHPEDMTAREAKEWVETGDKLVKTLAEQLDSEEQVQTGDQAVFDDVMGQLLAANVERGAAEQNATLMSSVFTTLGERTGIDPQELYQRYGLSISGRQLPEVLQNLADVDINLDPLLDRLRTGDIPSQQDIFGDSLVGFIRIHGGLKEDSELTDRDVSAQFPRGPDALLFTDMTPAVQASKKKQGGMTLDEAAELASEAGYIDEFDIGQFMEALDAELRGDFVASGATTNAEMQEIGQAMEELQGFLNEQNIDLADTENAAVKALLFPEGTTFEQSPLGFTSGLLTAAQNLKQGKGSAQQMLAMLKKQPGVKLDELEWVGVPEFLRAKEKVTKAELVEFIEANGVHVEEVTLGGKVKEDPPLPITELPEGWDVAIDRSRPEGQQYVVIPAGQAHGRPYGGMYSGTPEAATEAAIERINQIELDAYGARVDAETKFADYTLPGGQNYREVMLKLPTPETPRYKRTDLKLNAIESRDRDRGIFWIIDAPGQTYIIPKTKYADPEEAVQYVMREKSPDALPPVTFEGGHFDQPNVLAHFRIDDREGPNGEKILFVEEIQSDWHQAGRKLGYRQEEVVEGTGDSAGVPDAPFKGNAWAELSMKRLIRMAAEGGYDQLAWTTGEQQADRYDLSDKIDSIRVERRSGEDFRIVELHMPDGGLIQISVSPEGVIDNVTQLEMKPLEGKPLDEAVGKELADKVMADDLELPAKFEGIDLKVGGEGMKSFYDKTLRNIVNKVVRKLDKGVKVGDTQIASKPRLLQYQVQVDQAAEFHPEARHPAPAITGTGPITYNVRSAVTHETVATYESETEAHEEALRRNREVYATEIDLDVHAIDITDQIRTSALAGQTLFQGPKASITFDEATRKVAINLTKASDLSSFLHESGHFYLEVMGDLAEAENAPEQIVQDYAAILKHLGVENRQAIGEEQHEKLARSFEAYLMEGKAPSVELQAAFARFKAWLLNIYKRLTALDVDLNDEIRGVFDRLVATDEAIATAEESQNYVALFTTPETAGVSPETFAAYRKGVERARVEAEETLGRKLLDVKRREQLKWWQAEREKVLADVTTEIHGMREYRALAYLQKGKAPDGTELDIEHQKLSKDILVARYGAEFLKRLPRPYVYSVKGGLDPDEVALVFGFQSGQELVQELAEVKNRPMKQLIEAETDARMKERYPDPMLDGSMADEAQNAVHNDKRAELLAAELRMIRQLQRRDRPAVRAAEQTRQREEREARETLPDRDELKLIRMAAERMIGPRAPRDIKPHVFRSAESKAARLTRKALAKGDYQAAAFQKRRQILNHELFRAAEIAQTEAEKIREYFLTFRRKSVRTKIGKAQDGGLEKIEAILAEIDLHRISGAQIDRDKAKAEIRQAIEDGKMVATPEVAALFNGPAMPNWRELSIDSLRGIRDIVKQIEWSARRELEIVVNGETMEIEAVAGEIAKTILDTNKSVEIGGPGGLGQETKKDENRRMAREMISAWLNPSEIARVLDNEDFGPLQRHLIVVMRRAYGERLIPMQKIAQEDVAKIYTDHYSNQELAKFLDRTSFKVLGASLTRSEQLSLGLNMGNEGNRAAVLNGIKDGKAAFSQPGVAEVMATFDARDAKFFQAVWDYLDTYWAQLSAAQKRRRGIIPQKVEASPITIAGVNLPGGYFPLKYNPMISDRAKELQIEDYFNRVIDGTRVSTSTRAGATYERVGSGGQVVRLGLDIISQHLREVIRDIAIGDEVNFIHKVLNNKLVKNAMKETGNIPALNTLKLWLSDSAVGEMPADHAIEARVNWIRIGFVKAKLAWNAMVTLLQWTGITQTWAVVGSQAMAHGLGQYIKNPVQMHKHIMALSKNLDTRYRYNTWDKDVMDTQSHIMSGYGKLPAGVLNIRRKIAATYFYPIAKAQMMVDEVTWLAAMWKANNIENLGSGQDAIHYADAVVEQAQTSGFFSDRSGIERGSTGGRKTRQSVWVRLWTTLISYMLRKGNIVYQRTHQFNQNRTVKNAVFLATDIFLLLVLESMTTAALYGRFWDDDDDEPFVWWLAKESAESALAGIPLAREVPGAMFSSGNTPIGGLTTDIFDLGQQLGQWELDDTLLKELNNVGGILLHYPTSPINRALESAWSEFVEDEDVPFYEYVTGKRNRE